MAAADAIRLSLDLNRFYGADSDGVRARCCVMEELDVIHGTTVVGLSFEKLNSSAPVSQENPVTSTNPNVVVEVRGTAASIADESPTPATFALHVVSFSNTSQPAGRVNISIFNAKLFPSCSDCASCPWNLTMLALNTSTSSSLPSINCVNDISTVTMGEPAPWAILTATLANQ